MSNKFDVRYIAQLARIDLSEDEVMKFQAQLDQVLTHVERLGKVDVAHVVATEHSEAATNVFRADQPQPCMDRKPVLANAPREVANLFMVPKVIE